MLMSYVYRNKVSCAYWLLFTVCNCLLSLVYMYECMYVVVVVIVFADLAFNFFDLLAPQNLENEERE